jgi:hypothetical protein
MLKKILLVSLAAIFCLDANPSNTHKILETLGRKAHSQECLNKSMARAYGTLAFGVIMTGLLLNKEECSINERLGNINTEVKKDCMLTENELAQTFGLSALGGFLAYRIFRKNITPELYWISSVARQANYIGRSLAIPAERHIVAIHRLEPKSARERYEEIHGWGYKDLPTAQRLIFDREILKSHDIDIRPEQLAIIEKDFKDWQKKGESILLALRTDEKFLSKFSGKSSQQNRDAHPS